MARSSSSRYPTARSHCALARCSSTTSPARSSSPSMLRRSSSPPRAKRSPRRSPIRRRCLEVLAALCSTSSAPDPLRASAGEGHLCRGLPAHHQHVPQSRQDPVHRPRCAAGPNPPSAPRRGFHSRHALALRPPRPRRCCARGAVPVSRRTLHIHPRRHAVTALRVGHLRACHLCQQKTIVTS